MKRIFVLLVLTLTGLGCGPLQDAELEQQSQELTATCGAVTGADSTIFFNGFVPPATDLMLEGPARSKGLLKFDLASCGLPAGQAITVSAATLTLRATSTNMLGGPNTANTLTLYPVLRAWNETQATWSLAATGSSWASVGASGATDVGASLGTMSIAATPGSNVGTLSASARTLIESWHANAANNKGLLLTNLATTSTILASAEHATATYRPTLTLTYTVAAGASSLAGKKAATWNMQYGNALAPYTAMTPAGTCPGWDATNYGMSGVGAAWTNGHIKSILDTYIKNDPAVFVFGGTEVNVPMSASAVGTHLGWTRHEYGDDVIYARHGMTAQHSLLLSSCSANGYVARILYAKVYTNAAQTDWAHVFLGHWSHADLGTCSSGIQSTETLSYINTKATDGKPSIFMGDLNVTRDFGPSSIYYPSHFTNFLSAGFLDGYRTVYPNATTHPGGTGTWHSGYNPLPSSDPLDRAPWKRIDYILAKGAAGVSAAVLFGEPAVYQDCVASDHSGLIITLQ